MPYVWPAWARWAGRFPETFQTWCLTSVLVSLPEPSRCEFASRLKNVLCGILEKALNIIKMKSEAEFLSHFSFYNQLGSRSSSCQPSVLQQQHTRLRWIKMTNGWTKSLVCNTNCTHNPNGLSCNKTTSPKFPHLATGFHFHALYHIFLCCQCIVW
jgi:hypothetical protein